MKFLQGKKTYIVAGATVLLGICLGCGLELSPEHAESLQTILVGAAMAALRAGMVKEES